MKNIFIYLLFLSISSIKTIIFSHKSKAVFLELNKVHDSIPQTAINDDNMIYLHIIPHTHTDMGWLYTADSYYEGNSKGCVECILDEVTSLLPLNPERKFSFSEMGYFQRYWSEQTPQKKKNLKALIENGQFNLLNGGYVMNDEACAYYDDIIEQLTLGHRFIKKNFNKILDTAWHIDPFGHSEAQASIFSQMGFNNFFIERIDYEDFNERINCGSLEMIWKPQSSNKNDFIMTHVNFMKYYLAPLDSVIGVIMSNRIDDSAKIRIERYVNWIKNQSKAYSSNNILHHMGGDFEWNGDANYLFLTTDALIHYINSNSSLGIKASYSTPSIYAKAVYEETKRKGTKIDEKIGDFMPYRDLPNAYWTGFYTSRPYLKYAIRQVGQQLQSFRKLLSHMYLIRPEYYTLSFYEMDQALVNLEETVAIMQHHDSITGTSTQAVTTNDIQMIYHSYKDVTNVSVNMFFNA